ncbi:fatty acyl-AMP ligase [Streptomyces bohaiensis]|uniref:Fatty acyl-AMP ligase n=1 Tax=Streptomyces bohaiensis TaxID=1431344 RepID=A0ABX1CBH8_9ACTN|nr:fatty acyl-AMP ligase [Streptomyces bohaiensis]NJQ13669.1 fatty acyl-AMP ligase [Streptomyces bohaiensis]
MNRFLDMLRSTAATSSRGMVTGAPAAPVRRGWGDIHRQARRMAAELAAGGVRPRDVVALLTADPAQVAPAVQAVWLAGGTVTLLQQPTARTDLGEWSRDTLRVLATTGAELVLTGDDFAAVAPALTGQGIAHRPLSELLHLAADPAEPAGGGEGTGERGGHAEPVLPPPPGEDDLALLQLTSGSVSAPKAVMISHRNLHANITGMDQVSALDPDRDVVVSWLPLFHDMGLINLLITPMALGLELVKSTPADFLGSPLSWATLISEYRGTVTGAPNFGYALLTRALARVPDGDALDLSSLRLALNGAEPIDVASVGAFTTAGARFGMPAACIRPAYGMAEATVAVSAAPLFTGLSTDRLGEDTFARLGPPLPGLEASVVDGTGAPVGDRTVGRLRLRGTSIARGYLTADGPAPLTDEEGWLDTGDLGYLVDGEIVVCGRAKDVIIVGGRNLYPTDIERAADSVAGVRAGNVVAVRLDAGARRESFAVAAESRHHGDPEQERLLRSLITTRVVDALGARPASVHIVAPGTLPKTSSGKLRRSSAVRLVTAPPVTEPPAA